MDAVGRLWGPHGVPVVGIKQRAEIEKARVCGFVVLDDVEGWDWRRGEVPTATEENLYGTRAWELVEVFDQKICQQVLHVGVRKLTSDLGQEYWA
ncbi:hypothetical protein C1H46_017614 [Malus baccata]|uniref:Uncharacterized protein n=1 Tax=Malus baccata TaxID=106549 RepID=A0A540MDB8_MALBA|nr:hypothetical protein C1H46_017614 [Malus baccata]